MKMIVTDFRRKLCLKPGYARQLELINNWLLLIEI